jgi:surfactin synthase thioesterase subunit
MPARIQVLPVQLAGRGWRLNEPPVRDLDRLAEAVSESILPLTDLPYAVFGHSMGAWLAFEVVRSLEARGSRPVCLFASGRRAPSMPDSDAPLRHLGDEAFVREVQTRYGGIPAEILADAEVLSLLLPALRADIEALETYLYTPAPSLVCAIVALGGEQDPRVPVEHLAPWASETSGGFDVATFAGGHFYFQDGPAAVLDVIRRRLDRATGGVSVGLGG